MANPNEPGEEMDQATFYPNRDELRLALPEPRPATSDARTRRTDDFA